MAKKTSRDDDLSTRPKIREKLLKLFADVEKGFSDQRDRADANLDHWDAYDCILGEKQFYNGNSKIYVPIIRGAVNARATRFANQAFPQSGRNVEVITTDGEIPHAEVALVEHYVEQTRLRTEIIPAMLRAGDIEGQMTLYVTWDKSERHVVSRETKPVTVDGLEVEALGKTETMKSEVISASGPAVEVVLDSDLLILPVTVDNIERALEKGGSVTILRRWSAAELERMADDGEIIQEEADEIVEQMRKDQPPRTDTVKKLAEASGIHVSGDGVKSCWGYETWVKLKVDGKRRTCVARFGGESVILGCKLNPFWCDHVPVITAAVQKLPGVAKGQSLLKPGVMDLQIGVNDTVNEAWDQGHFAMFPIIMTDPEKNPRVGTMVLDLAAVWETSPKDTQITQFPDTTAQALQRVGWAKAQIFESLSVNPSMLPQQTGGKGKRNQAEIALEQQVDVLTTADAVTNLEQAILTPLVQRFLDYDHQFREKAVLVRSYGEMGMRAIMQEIPPIQMNRRWTLRWFGVEAARSAAQIQQQIAGLNVIKSIPPQLYPGYTLDATPLLTHLAENAFGARLAPLIFKSVKDQQTVDAKLENEMLGQGFDLAVHPLDNDPEHIKAHMELMKQGDPMKTVATHIQKHQMSMQLKSMAQMMPKGGGQPQPGGGGGPKPGSQVAPLRGAKGPPGMIHADRMPAAGAVTMPRKT